MPYKDKNFRDSLVLDFEIWWRHVKTTYWYSVLTHHRQPKLTKRGVIFFFLLLCQRSAKRDIYISRFAERSHKSKKKK